MKKLKIPVFNQTILVSNKISEIKKYCKRNNFHLSATDHLHQTLGCVSVLPSIDEDGDPTNEGALYMYVSEGASIPTIVHESTHAAMMLCEHIGVSVDVDEQETYAYLTAFIFNEFCRMYDILPKDKLDIL